MLARTKRFLRPLLVRRRFQVYGVGTARSGTHSLTSLFASGYRASHEPLHERLMAMILERHAGTLSSAALRAELRERDRTLWLELDSSQLNYFVLQDLRAIAPDAKFILTARDCRSWLTSFIDHQISGPTSERWVQMRKLRFERKEPHPPEERALKERGLFTLDGYLGYWARHNREVLETVPSDRLLVLPTERIDQSGAELARFLSIDPSLLAPSRAHSNKAVKKHDILAELDPGYLEDAFQRNCADVMRALFGRF
jgi:hypothetical protein